MKIYTVAPLLGAVLMLGACGGSGTGDILSDQTGGTQNLGSASFTALSSSGLRLVNKYADADFTETMPVTGTATYRGVAAYSSETNVPEEIVGDPSTLSAIEVTADFARSTLSGRAYNFKSNDPRVRISGQVEVVNGMIDGNTFSAELDGTTTETFGGISGNVSYSGSVEGAFAGSGAQALFGTGTAYGFVEGLGVSDPIYTVWGAEKR